MKNRRHFLATWKFLGLTVLTALVNVLALGPIHLPFLQAGLGFVWLFLLPGYSITRLANLRTDTFWGNVSLSTGFGILAAMVSALVINTILPLAGIHDPLSTANLILGFDAVWFVLSGLTWYKTRHQATTYQIPALKIGTILATLGGLPAILLAILGAISLNNGGTGLITYTMLVYAAIYLAILVWKRDSLPENTILTGIYSIGLALLLMTSLRGWFTTGHDIQREYYVFMLTLNNLHWSPAAYHDAYNACLSITIMPTVIHKILGIDPSFVYKTVFQVLFALVPVLVYLIARRFTSRLVALLAAIYFIAFPTYFQDMPMLNRQEMAFFFMSLGYFAVFHDAWSLKVRRWILLVFGTGVILSHYSTTYTMLLIFGLVISLRYALQITGAPLGKFLKRPLIFGPWLKRRAITVNTALVITLLAISYIWSSQLTNTGGNVSRVAGETLRSIQQGLKGDTRSSDTNYGLFAPAKLTDEQRLNKFATVTVPLLRHDVNEEQLYPPFDYSKYPVAPAVQPSLSLTSIGRLLSSHGVNVPGFNTATRQGSALFLQLMLLAGLTLLFVGKPFRRALSNEYRLFQLGSVILIGAIIALPVLSAEYGLLRAFQQVLILSGVAIVLATRAVIPAKLRRLRTVLPTVIALGFFLSSTGVITASLGGYPAQIHLANDGKYYDLFYPREAEAQGAQWLNNNLPHSAAAGNVVSTVETDRYFNGPHALQVALPHDNAFPGLIQRDAYVFLGYTALTQDLASLYYNGDDITYTYPVQFLDDTKDLIYSNQGTRVYR